MASFPFMVTYFDNSGFICVLKRRISVISAKTEIKGKNGEKIDEAKQYIQVNC